MPVTSYTSLLGLALPTTGDLSGTWGDTVNNSITSLLDSAVAGTTTLSTDTDVTLTTTQGSSNQSRQQILLCSGSRTVQRTITAPAASKVYVIINATTGGFAVKIVGAGPTTGVTVANGKSAVVAWNGSDFVTVSTNDVASVANGGTGLSTLTANNVILGNGTSAVQFVAPGTNGNVLTSNGTTWVSSAAASAGVTSFSAGTTGFTPNTATTGAITLAGTLDVDNGGTGQTTYTNGQLLIGNTTGNTLTKATLTQGTGITITNGAGSITIAATSTGGFSNIASFTSPGPSTWTAPPTTTMIKVTVIGGGGAGGGSNSPTTVAGAGGGGGGAAVQYLPVTGGTSYSYTVGAAGAATPAPTAPSVTSAGSGGTSSFGPVGPVTLSATGGAGGDNAGGSGGAGGTGSGGTAGSSLLIGGSAGAPTGSANIGVLAGMGGSSIYGGGAKSVNYPSPAQNGSAGNNYGGGGSGSYGASARTGGAGAPGVVIIEY
jgi:hypothetical protein